MATRPEDEELPTQPRLFEEDSREQSSNPRFPKVDDSETADLLIAILALKFIKGVGYKTIRALFDASIVHRLLSLNRGDTVGLTSTLPSPAQIDLETSFFPQRETIVASAHKTAEDFQAQGIWFIPIGHRDYPSRFHRMADPPRWIFGRGNIQAAQAKSIVAVVGTREASPAGQRLAYRCASELARRNIVVLSGLAKGIDEKAHMGATDYYGQSVAVLGHGIAVPTGAGDQLLSNRIIETDGVVLSEYLPLDSPSRTTFLRRNELQVALSRLVIPVESPSLESGTGATIRRALSIGTPLVGVFPGSGEEDTLLQTRDNLTRLGIPVYTVMGSNSDEFWNFLMKVIPEHNWAIAPEARKRRFLQSLERAIQEAHRTADLDKATMSRLIRLLRNEANDQAG